MSELALIYKERHWDNQISSAIDKNNKATFSRLLDEPIGMVPRLDVLKKLLEADVKTKPLSRQRMAIELLNHPRFEMQAGVDGDDFMHAALTIPMLDIIPVLHAKGFHMRPRIIHLSLMVSHLSCGRWPHPELLAPDLLDSQQTGLRKLCDAMFSHPLVIREEFVRKLVGLPNGAEWVQETHKGLLGACATGKIQDLIDTGKMDRSQVLSSMALLHARGWISQDGFESSAAKQAYMKGDWLVWTRDLMSEVAAHDEALQLQKTTPNTSARPATRRI